MHYPSTNAPWQHGRFLLTYRKPPIIVCIFATITRDLIVWAYTRVSLSISLKARLHGYSELSWICWQCCISCPSSPICLEVVKVKPKSFLSVVSHYCVVAVSLVSEGGLFDKLTVTAAFAFLEQRRGTDEKNRTQCWLWLNLVAFNLCSIYIFLSIIDSHGQGSVSVHAAAAKSLQSCPTLWPYRRQPTRLPRPWDSPGKSTGVGCHFRLQCMKLKSESEVAQSCPTLSDPMDCSLPGSSVHGIFQARVLEWVAISFSTSSH